MIFQHAHMYVAQLCCIVMGVLNPCVNIGSHEDFKACMIMSKPLKVDRIQTFLLEVARLTCMQYMPIRNSLQAW